MKKISELKAVDKNLKQHLKFEHLITETAARFANVQSETIDAEIQETLSSLGRFLKSERAFVFQFTDDGKSLKNTHVWAAKGFRPQSEIFELDLASDIPWVARQIRSGRVIAVGPGYVGLPDEAQELRKQLERDGINSGFVVPISVEGRSIGMFGLDTVDKARDYLTPLINRMRVLADMIGSALVRVRSQRKLEQYRHIVESTTSIVGMVDQNYVYQYVNDAYCAAFKKNRQEIIGKSAPVMEMLSRVEKVARTDTTVLILGETGTGKELLVRSIHKLSSRQKRQMIKVNCAAMPPTLIESELFGREKGAFTGAMTRQIGRFEIADGSTIFLDEIGELPLDVQAKLLRVLQEGQFERLGNPKTITVNTRIIASTNRDLARAVANGRFREDLYYCLNVFSVTAHPLRNRIEDIPF